MKINYQIYPTILDSFYWAKRLGKWQELIDKINRVKVAEWPEAVQKGMCFEQTVNELLNKQPGTRPKEVNGQLIYRNTKYDFDAKLVDLVVKKLSNCQDKQQFVQGEINTPLGGVKLYGYIDYVYPEFYIDLKTCGEYKKDKYKTNAQHKCYPIIGSKKSLTYYITDFRHTFTETYVLTPALKDEFVGELTEFIEWLNQNKEQITDTKIFNL
jgi:hypothetical protein